MFIYFCLSLLFVFFSYLFFFFFFFNDTATTEIYTLSLHDALPISSGMSLPRYCTNGLPFDCSTWRTSISSRSEEHTSELQSRFDLVCRLLLEKKKKKTNTRTLVPCQVSVSIKQSINITSL